MQNLHLVSGYAGGVIIAIACWVYILSIARGKTHSNKITWGVWTLVTALTLFTYYGTNGLVSSLWVYVAYLFGTAGTFVALLIYSKAKGEWSWFEKTVLVGICITLIAWVLFRSSELAMTFILIVDILGAVLLIKTVYHDPSSEYGPGWYWGFVGNFVNLLAVERWDYQNDAYPIYLALMTFCVSLLIFFPRFLRR